MDLFNRKNSALFFLIAFQIFIVIAIFAPVPNHNYDSQDIVIELDNIDHDSEINYVETPTPADDSYPVKWTEDGVQVGSSPGSYDDNDHDICVDGSGGWFFGWVVGSDGIWGSRYNANGENVWGSISLCDAADPQRKLAMAAGSSTMLMAWYDDRGTGKRTYSARITLTGSNDYNPPNCHMMFYANPGLEVRPDLIHNDAGHSIVAQRLNDNINVHRMTGTNIHAETTVCSASNVQRYPKICKDGSGGGIVTWEDYRSGTNYDIYAAHYTSTGGLPWTSNGEKICTSANDQSNPRICADGNGGAYIVWESNNGDDGIFTQYINSTGDTQWINNGTCVVDLSNTQRAPRVCSDENGNMYVAWVDSRDATDNYDIYVQNYNSTGDPQWTTNGFAVCTETGNQGLYSSNFYLDICATSEGVVVAWSDYRGSNCDIYAQYVVEGASIWDANGTVVCDATGDQFDPKVEYDDDTSVCVAWRDGRGANDDIYAQCLNVDLTPISDSPPDFSDSIYGADNITWTLTDRMGGDQYRVIANDTNGAYYVWKDWSDWSVDVPLIVEINRSAAGIFNYTIEYNNTIGSSGVPDSVIVELIDNIPASNHPSDITTLTTGSEVIPWKIWDHISPGKYRVITNDTYGDYYVWDDWDDWLNDTFLNVAINRSEPGIFNFTIQFNNSAGGVGIADTVIVNISQDNLPTASNQGPVTTTRIGKETINWTIADDYGVGQYRVIANNTNGDFYIWEDWQPWFNNINLQVQINRTFPGIFNYTIEYNDSAGQSGIVDMVVVTITNLPPEASGPEILSTSLVGTETIDWVLTDDYGEGQYRVIANDTNGIFYIWEEWDDWSNDSFINVAINRSKPGIFNYTIEYNDTYGISGIQQTVIVSISNPPPTWDEEPSDQTIEFGLSFFYDVNATDESGIDKYWINNTDFDMDGDGKITNKTPLSVGVIWVEIRACDPYNSNASKIINITVEDTTDPTWDEDPEDRVVELGFPFSYDLNASDLSGINKYWINNTNFDIAGDGKISNNTPLSVGVIWVEIRACDPYNNNASKIINITVEDTIKPSVDAILPGNYTSCNSIPNIQITASDEALNTTWYEYGLYIIIVPNGASVPLDGGLWASLADEQQFTLYIFANDSDGNINDSFSLVLYKDIDNPDITITTPESNKLCGITAPTVMFTNDDLYQDSEWFMIINATDLGDYTDNYTWTGDISVAWAQFGNGSVIIRIYANDTAGNIGYSEISVRKDLIAPDITITEPTPNKIIGQIAPNFFIDINEPNLDTTWYYLEDGTTSTANSTFIYLTDSWISQSIWNQVKIGYVNISFYANDTVGNIGFKKITVIKNEYWYIDPISIDNLGSGDYFWSEIAYMPWCSGSGSFIDPYVIAYLHINGKNTTSCITINNSNVYFRIENGIFYNSGFKIYDAGIRLENVTNSELKNNNCSLNNRNGLCLINCFNNTITGNTLNNNTHNGLALINSNYNSIINNFESFNYNGFSGIYLYNSHRNNITGNTVNYNYYGICLNLSSYNYILGNTFLGNSIPAILINSLGNKLPPELGGLDHFQAMFFLSMGFGLIAGIAIIGISMQKRRAKKKEQVVLPKKKILLRGKMTQERKIGVTTSASTEAQPKSKPEKKKLSIGEETKKELTEEQKRELEKTEEEIAVEKKRAKCIVHKGPIVGANVYICPHCETYYCLECAKMLKGKGEKCWSCENEIEI